MFKELRKKIWANIVAKIEKEFEEQQKSLLEGYKQKAEGFKKELDEKEYEVKQSIKHKDNEAKDQLDLRIKFEQANNDLREQIRLIQAKASPDSVYTEAFTLGFSKAFDMASEVLGYGFRKMKDLLVDKARKEEQAKIEEIVKARIARLDTFQLKEKAQILEKLKSLEQDYLEAGRKGDQSKVVKLEAGIEVLKWVLKFVSG